MKSKFILKLLILSCVAALSLQSVAQAALSDESSKIGNGIFYYSPNDACGAGLPSAEPTIDSGGNVEQILRFFTGKGLTLAAAAGFVGNMNKESGLNPRNVENASENQEPNASVNGRGDAKPATIRDGEIDLSTMYTPIDGTGIGLVQWTWGGYKPGERENPNSFNSRQGALYHFAVEQKKDIVDINLQLEFVWVELSSGYQEMLSRLSSITDPVEAAVIIHDTYEVSADTDIEVRNGRGGDARNYYNSFRNSIPDGTGVTPAVIEMTSPTDGSSCAVENTADGGLGVSGDFTFPLKTTQATIKKGVDGSVWCSESLENCHHDYNAADIFAETGTPIVAAKPGKVVNKTTDACTNHSVGCNVSIKGDDGLLYYYAHMSEHATVEIGQQVSAGEQLGGVGTNVTAMGTTRHLHFDITRGNFRPACAGAACNDRDFINSQPLLVPAFKELPEGVADV